MSSHVEVASAAYAAAYAAASAQPPAPLLQPAPPISVGGGSSFDAAAADPQAAPKQHIALTQAPDASALRELAGQVDLAQLSRIIHQLVGQLKHDHERALVHEAEARARVERDYAALRADHERLQQAHSKLQEEHRQAYATAKAAEAASAERQQAINRLEAQAAEWRNQGSEILKTLGKTVEAAVTKPSSNRDRER